MEDKELDYIERVILKIPGGYDTFDLEKTLYSGQCFRFEKLGEKNGRVLFSISSGKNAAIVSQTKNRGDMLVIECPGSQITFWKEYFCANNKDRIENVPLHKLTMAASGSVTLATIVTKGRGLLILKQDPLETFISFIISQNNSITRISRIMNNIAYYGGKQIFINGYTVYTLPDAKGILSVIQRETDQIKLGYRKPYIVNFCEKMIRESYDFSWIHGTGSSYDYAVSRLLAVPGIGPKVADCILLFAFGYVDAFPTDTWISKGLNLLHSNGYSYTKLKSMFTGCFGLFQQCLFIFLREGGSIGQSAAM